MVSEVRPPEIRAKWCYGDYTMVFKKYYETDSSFAYHHLNKMIEHWTFKKGHTLQSEEMTELKRRIVLEDRHLWIHVLVEQDRVPYKLKPRRSKEC